MLLYQHAVVIVTKNKTLHFNQHFQKEMTQFCDDYKIEYKISVNQILNEIQMNVKGKLYDVEKLEAHLQHLNEGFGEYIKEINDYKPI